ncbi:Rtf2 RING-finger-domain-containing protein [Limtongia smithiae]|uniref:Rtf2 RING-finger-domain-containing protein n=1 Tax=Limtongia smithiae TaxID=1125753 RepID=UPI0034CE54C0
MGNDGGSIPTRRELVKSSSQHAPTASELFEHDQLNTAFAWTTCRLSNKPLQLPLVSDYLGRLYNQDAVLEYLVSPKDFSGEGTTATPHIASLKDVVVLKIATDPKTKKWICPVTFKEIKSGGTKFVYLAECGHVFAESAFKAITDTTTCFECGTSYQKSNLITINPSSKADTEALKIRMDDLRARGLSHSLKPLSQKKKRKHIGTGSKDDKKSKRKEAAGINNEVALKRTQEVIETLSELEPLKTDAIKKLHVKT